MKDKLKDIFNKIRTNKRLFFIVSLTVMVLFCLVLNITFSAFTASRERNAVNIIVGLNYTTDLNNNTFQVPAGQVTKTNITLVSNNNIDTRYEITYEICANAACTSTVNPPVTGLTVEYSSKSPGGVNDVVSKLSTKVIRLVVTNTSSTTYYIKVGINAGFKNNAVDTTGLNTITSEYDESDLTVQTYINGTASSTFPTSANYWATLSCVDILGNPLSTSGSAVYKNSQWYIRIDNLTNAETTCSVNFTTTAHLTKIEDLVVLSNNTYDGMKYQGVTFYLDNDLNFNNNSSYADYTRTDYGDINGNGTIEPLKTELTTGKGFRPISSGGSAFQGTFNGQNHTISNLYINNSSLSMIAFFSDVWNTTISNLTLGGTITCSGSNNLAAGLVGQVRGSSSTISNCTNNVNVTSSASSSGSASGGIVGTVYTNVSLTLNNVTNTGTVSGGESTGGIVGSNKGTVTISTATNSGNVSNSLGKFAGGMLGSDATSTNSTTITGATNSGQISAVNGEATSSYVGGLVGYVYGSLSITNGTNNGAVSANNDTYSSSYKYVGGILGAMNSDSPSALLNNCNNTTSVTGGHRAGGLIGNAGNTSTIIVNSSNTGTVSSAATNTAQNGYFGGLVGFLASQKAIKIINSFNSGTVNISMNSAVSDKSVLASGLIGGTSSGSTPSIYNSYNSGNVTITSTAGTKYATGITYRSGTATCVINNVHNYGTLTASSGTFTIGRVGSTTGLTVTNAFYLSTTTATDITVTGTISKTDTYFKAAITNTSGVGYLLNQGKNNIASADVNNYTLKTWARKSTSPTIPIFSS